MISFLIVLGCLLINALLACAEMAFVSVDKRKLKSAVNKGDARASIIEKMHRQPEKLLSVIQIGITLVGAISAAVSGAGAEESIAPLFERWFNISEGSAEMLAIAFVVLPLTTLSVVIGELVPKSIALSFAYPIIIKMSRWLKLAVFLLGPLIAPMGMATKFILRLVLSKKDEENVIHNAEEVSLAGLKKEHKQYVFNVLELDNKVVKNVMMPWAEVDIIDYLATSEEVVDQILKNGHTRLPVLANKQVCGFLHSKEFLNLFRAGAEKNWMSFMRAPKFIEKNAKLLDVLKRMQKERIHLMIVGDEDHPEGIITLEDVLEVVVGDIFDENEDGRVQLFLRGMVSKKL